MNSSIILAKSTTAGLLVLAFWSLVRGELVQTSTTTQSATGQFELNSGHAGILEVGEPVEDVYQAYGRERVRLTAQFPEGMFAPVLEISDPSSDVDPALVVEVREAPCPKFSVWAIDVRDRRFRTKEGVGIGSSLRDLRRSYKIELLSGEGAIYAGAKETGLSFRLSAAAPSDSAVVISVRVVPDPERVRQQRCPGRQARERSPWFLENPGCAADSPHAVAPANVVLLQPTDRSELDEFDVLKRFRHLLP